MTANLSPTGKLILQAPLALHSPLIIGCGQAEKSDVDVLRDPLTSAPLLPATSIIGAGRAYLETGLRATLAQEARLRENFIYLFGDREAERAQSALQVDDLLLPGASITVRDGVAIDPASNLAAERKKYCYEIVESAPPFLLHAEITLRPGFDAALFKRLLLTWLAGLAAGHIRLGAKTNKGFGRVQLNLEQARLQELQFTARPDVWQWLSGEYGGGQKLTAGGLAPFAIHPRQFKIEGRFCIKNSLLVRSYSPDPRHPETVAITRARPAGKAGDRGAVLPGTSLMGAVQHRCRKILHTLGDEQAADKLAGLFGFVSEAPGDSSALKGRVRVEETWIAGAISRIQSRIKIDRFTAGAFHGALFETMPQWPAAGKDHVEIVMTVKDYQEWEAGLLLQVLKDLWTGDLAIGGEKSVGRGVLQGRWAKITGDDLAVELLADKSGAPVCKPEDRQKLEALAQALIA
ncbi:MAG: hypothetical protein DKINENOH_04826 [bacterium]|nr:hypothetical protein [bacterium]